MIINRLELGVQGHIALRTGLYASSLTQKIYSISNSCLQNFNKIHRKMTIFLRLSPKKLVQNTLAKKEHWQDKAEHFILDVGSIEWPLTANFITIPLAVITQITLKIWDQHQEVSQRRTLKEILGPRGYNSLIRYNERNNVAIFIRCGAECTSYSCLMVALTYEGVCLIHKTLKGEDIKTSLIDSATLVCYVAAASNFGLPGIGAIALVPTMIRSMHNPLNEEYYYEEARVLEAELCVKSIPKQLIFIIQQYL